MLSDRHVLVVEAEFLIALDMQRILEQAHAARIVFARTIAEAADLGEGVRAFDLALVELPPGDPAAVALARQLRSAGVAVAVTIAATDLQYGLPGLDGVPFLRKPFSDLDLLAACSLALAARADDGEPGRLS